MTHLKKSVSESGRLVVKQTCGDCIHFKINAKFGKPCAQLGIKTYASAPNCYSPNVYSLVSVNPQALYQLSLLFHSLNSSQSRILMSILGKAKSFTKGYGLKFGQPVYFRVGDDYLGNYFKGYVAGVSSLPDNQVYVTSDLGGHQRTKPTIAALTRASIMSNTEFLKHREKLIQCGRVKDSENLFKIKSIKASVPEERDIPTMDTVPEEWYKDLTARLANRKTMAAKSKTKKIAGKTTYKIDHGRRS